MNKVRATSEHTIFLILSVLRNINKLINKPINFKKKYISNEVSNLKVGILGYGRVGKQVATILRSFGAKVYIFDIRKKSTPKYINVCNSIKELFLTTDLISLHIPLAKKNYNLINKINIKFLKNKILINTSRAEIIDELSLIEMIRRKKIIYFTDVIHHEHKPFNHNKLAKIQSYDNLFITPHIAGITEQSIRTTDLYLINLFLNDQKRNNNCEFIAELCQNHLGKRSLLDKMVNECAENGADTIKIQNIFANNLTFRPRFENGLTIKNKTYSIKRPYKQEYNRLKNLELSIKDNEYFIRLCEKIKCYANDNLFF